MRSVSQYWVHFFFFAKNIWLSSTKLTHDWQLTSKKRFNEELRTLRYWFGRFCPFSNVNASCAQHNNIHKLVWLASILINAISIEVSFLQHSWYVPFSVSIIDLLEACHFTIEWLRMAYSKIKCSLIYCFFIYKTLIENVQSTIWSHNSAYNDIDICSITPCTHQKS